MYVLTATPESSRLTNKNPVTSSITEKIILYAAVAEQFFFFRERRAQRQFEFSAPGSYPRFFLEFCRCICIFSHFCHYFSQYFARTYTISTQISVFFVCCIPSVFHVLSYSSINFSVFWRIRGVSRRLLKVFRWIIPVICIVVVFPHFQRPVLCRWAYWKGEAVSLSIIIGCY